MRMPQLETITKKSAHKSNIDQAKTVRLTWAWFFLFEQNLQEGFMKLYLNTVVVLFVLMCPAPTASGIEVDTREQSYYGSNIASQNQGA